MRIAYLALGFPPDPGGSENYNGEMARRLHARGHDVRVMTWARGSEVPDLPFELRHAPPVPRGRPIPMAPVAAALDAWQPDVALVARGSRALGAVVRETAGRIPVVLCLHAFREKHRGRSALGRWRVRRRYGLDRADRVVACSKDTRSRLLDLGVEAARLALVYPGADTRRFRPDPAAGLALRRDLGVGDRPLLLTVARLVSNKNHASVLRALPALRREFPDLAYAVVGGGPLRAELEARVRRLGLEDAVLFTGHVEDALPFYQACDAFVMPSAPPKPGATAGEGFGIAYVEAGACGKPVVASTSGGGAEIVIDGETGFLVEPRDEARLAAVLRELLARPARARALGARGAERAREFDWEVGASALEKVLASVSGRER